MCYIRQAFNIHIGTQTAPIPLARNKLLLAPHSYFNPYNFYVTNAKKGRQKSNKNNHIFKDSKNAIHRWRLLFSVGETESQKHISPNIPRVWFPRRKTTSALCRLYVYIACGKRFGLHIKLLILDISGYIGTINLSNSYSIFFARGNARVWSKKNVKLTSVQGCFCRRRILYHTTLTLTLN